MKKILSPALCLALGLSLVFGVFGIQKVISPLVWIGWMPPWMDGLLGLSALAWTRLIGGIEIVLALGLWIPRIRKAAALLMALHLLGVLYQTGLSDIGIRDIGLLFMALGLFFSHEHKD